MYDKREYGLSSEWFSGIKLLTERFESTGDSFLGEVASFSAGFSLVLWLKGGGSVDNMLVHGSWYFFTEEIQKKQRMSSFLKNNHAYFMVLLRLYSGINALIQIDNPISLTAGAVIIASVCSVLFLKISSSGV